MHTLCPSAFSKSGGFAAMRCDVAGAVLGSEVLACLHHLVICEHHRAWCRAGSCSCPWRRSWRSQASWERCCGASGAAPGGASGRGCDEIHGRRRVGCAERKEEESRPREGQGAKDIVTGRGQCGRNMVASGVLSSDFWNSFLNVMWVVIPAICSVPTGPWAASAAPAH